MKFRQFFSLLLFALAGSLCAGTASAQGAKGSRGADAMTLNFNGSEYVYRWAKGGQYEFLPRNDSDLAKWKDMVTVNLHPKVTTSEQLAAIANKVIANYQGMGKVLRADSKARTPSRPAEHVIVAVLGTGEFMEAVFARLMLIDGSGVIAVYSHRIYGKSAGPAMSEWLKANGPKAEAALKLWDGVPTSAALQKLPPRS